MLRITSAFVLLCLVSVITLTGCSSSHTLQFDATQPVYFGSAPLSLLPLDTAHVTLLRQVTLSSSHQFEKEPTSGGEVPLYKGAETDKIVGDVAAQLEDLLNHDQAQFIANASYKVEIEANITVAIDLFSFFFGGSTSDASGGEPGRSSTETISVIGTVYKNARTGR